MIFRNPIHFFSVYEWLGGDQGMTDLLENAGMRAVKHPERADLVVFNGGADIGTELYGESPVRNGVPRFMSIRDKDELQIYNLIRGRKFALGICRGAQFLNVLNGGTLFQHANHHNGSHKMTDLPTGKVYTTTSTHHQMMRPNTKEGTVIAVAHESTEKYADETAHPIHPDERNVDTEIVWYPKNKTLCVQGHPEYVPGSAFAEYIIDMVKDYMKEAA